jgi:hypothetical protein
MILINSLPCYSVRTYTNRPVLAQIHGTSSQTNAKNPLFYQVLEEMAAVPKATDDAAGAQPGRNSLGLPELVFQRVTHIAREVWFSVGENYENLFCFGVFLL